MTNRHTGSQTPNPEFGPPRDPAYRQDGGFYPTEPYYRNEEVSNSYVPRPYGYPPPPAINNTYVQMPQPFNHTLHVLLDFATCGLWVPVHMILWAIHGR